MRLIYQEDKDKFIVIPESRQDEIDLLQIAPGKRI